MEISIQVVIGGILLGLASGLLLLIRGKILGCSGMIFRCMDLSKSNLEFDSIFFVLGLFLSGLGYYFYQHVPNPNAIFQTSLWVFFIGGIFTGAGTFIGNGCTSGHGLCGMALMRKRSIVAVSCFFPVAILTAWIFH